ncbi:MAG TPA: phosphotransferase, partial [Woeseiaceae bacterium]|nr:phosphotransferase [Woeseiaceae bacterium]
VRRSRPAAEPAAAVEELMGPWLESRNLLIREVSEIAIPAHNGIFNEVAAARAGGTVGMHRYRLALRDRVRGREQALDILVKTKPSDTVMQDLMVEVAALCHPELGAQCESFREDLGLTGCHERELALYETTDPVLRRYMPLIFGTSRSAEQDTWSIAMQYLQEAETVDLRTAHWSGQQLNAVLHGLAEVHAVNYCRANELARSPWLGKLPGAARTEEMSPFWIALADHSAPYFDQWLDQSLRPLQRSLIASVGSWWAEMRAMPQTLVHNDCNPRNLVIRNGSDGLVPVFFDWELATIDVPQRDVAEILCFMLPPGSGAAEITGWIEAHRRGLGEASETSIGAGEYVRGFRLALCHLLIHRLPLYTLMHRIRPQAFLPRVMRNWHTLYRLSGALPLRPAAHASRPGRSSV